MDQTALYWTIVAGTITGIWALLSEIRSRNLSRLQRSNALMQNLIDTDRLLVEHPEIAKYLAEHAHCDEEYFRTEAVLHDLMFYRAKTYVYSRINLFDSLLSEQLLKSHKILDENVKEQQAIKNRTETHKSEHNKINPKPFATNTNATSADTAPKDSNPIPPASIAT